MEIPTLKVKLLHPKAKLPTYAHPGDAGLDLCTPEKIIIKPSERVVVDTGVALELPEGTVGLIWDKSSLGCQKGLKVLGGVFDQGYRGSYTIGVINLSKEDIIIEEGEKFCQLLIQPIVRVGVTKVKNIETNTKRGTGRMGSTGR